MKDKPKSRITSEKPISLYPLKPDEALSALLKVKPEPKKPKTVKKTIQKMDK
jgi:hypothetical protein